MPPSSSPASTPIPPTSRSFDIRMPPTHTTEGLDAAHDIKATQPQVGVLVLSAHVELHYALQVLEDNASGAGYLLKNAWVTCPS